MDVGPLIPIVAILVTGFFLISRVPMARAYVNRMSGTDDDTQRQLAHLTDEIARLSQESSEAQERLDFTERLLARAPTALPGATPASVLARRPVRRAARG